MRTPLALLRLLCMALPLSLIGVDTATAQAVSDIKIDSPAIMLLQKSMANRFVQLRPHLQAGLVGMTHDGLVALRDSGAIEVKALLAIGALIAEENKDRTTLYREIARANSRPEWEGNLRAVFGQRWIKRMPVGWFYRDDKGTWLLKEQP